jgi:hypothetical protein
MIHRIIGEISAGLGSFREPHLWDIPRVPALQASANKVAFTAFKKQHYDIMNNNFPVKIE